MDREQYERDLKRRQEEHLGHVRGHQDADWKPCMHDGCPECIGTGVKRDGSICIHMLYCSCPKCSPRCSAMDWNESETVYQPQVTHGS